MTTIDPTPTPPDPERRAFTLGLRSLADWLEAHPEVALPYPAICIYSSAYGDGAAVQEAAAFARAAGTADKKVEEGSSRFALVRHFGPLALEWSATRSAVCEMRTVTKEVTEWVCPDSLLREADERAEAEAAS